MNKLYILILAIILSSCVESDYEVKDRNSVHGYNVIKIDGCEYLRTYREMSHKGNCTNSIHKTKEQ